MLYKNLNIRLPKVKVATGLYSHWDSVIKVDKKILEWIKTSIKKKPKGLLLDSLGEIIYSLNEASKGEDKESLISEKVYNGLNLSFPKREFRTGGNGNNMGKTLLELGITPLVSYPLRSEKLMNASPNFRIACNNKLKKPKQAIRKGDPDYDHIIFEFEKCRHILSWDLMSTRGIFDYDFLKIASNPKLTDILVLGYAHLLLPKLKKKTDEIIEFLKEKRPKVHLEFGLGSKESMKYAMNKFSEHNCCDSWGLNEEECKTYLNATSDNVEDLIEAASNAVRDYNLNRICIHTLKFVFSISLFDRKKEFDALTSACLVAAAKTFGKLDLKSARLLHAYERVIKKKIGKYNFCLITSLINPTPKALTGIGDSFAAVQAVKVLS